MTREERLAHDGAIKLASEKRLRRWQEPEKKTKRRARLVKKLYGLTPAAYAYMLAAHAGLCAICRKAPSGHFKQLAVDHCHKTGRVRGLLCHACNRALGLLEDDAQRALRVAQYLIRTKESEK